MARARKTSPAPAADAGGGASDGGPAVAAEPPPDLATSSPHGPAAGDPVDELVEVEIASPVKYGGKRYGVGERITMVRADAEALLSLRVVAEV